MSLDVTITILLLLFRELEFQEAINILTGSTKYQGIAGCFCDNVVIMLLSRPEDGYFC